MIAFNGFNSAMLRDKNIAQSLTELFQYYKQISGTDTSLPIPVIVNIAVKAFECKALQTLILSRMLFQVC